MRYFAAPAPTTRPGDAGEIGGAAVPMTLRVSVDQAMRTVFSELAKRFQIDHPGTQIQLKFKRSQELADELERSRFRMCWWCGTWICTGRHRRGR